MSKGKVFDREKVAGLLEKEMGEQGWQATALSRKAKLHDHSVYHFLNKKTNNVEKLQAIAAVLGKDISYFLTSEEQPKINVPTQDDIPYNGELVREAMKIVEEIMEEKGISLSKAVVDNFTETVYKHFQKKEYNGKIKEYALGVIEYALNNKLVTCKSS